MNWCRRCQRTKSYIQFTGFLKGGNVGGSIKKVDAERGLSNGRRIKVSPPDMAGGGMRGDWWEKQESLRQFCNTINSTLRLAMVALFKKVWLP